MRTKGFTLDETMFILGLTKSQIQRLVQFGKLKITLVNRRMLFFPATLQQYVFNMDARLKYALTHDQVELF